MLVRGIDFYDFRFGAAFHDGSWNADFEVMDLLQDGTYVRGRFRACGP